MRYARGLMAALIFGALAGCWWLPDDTTSDTPGARADVFSLQVGDCFTDEALSSEGEVEEMRRVACKEPHRQELYFSHELPKGTYPGEDVVEDTANDVCESSFEAYVGVAYQDSVFAYTYLGPSAETWRLRKDREILCMLTLPDDALRSGSAKGSKM